MKRKDKKKAKASLARRVIKKVGDAVRGAAKASALPVRADLAPTEIKQMKPMLQRQERVIFGMGSGGPEDMNTYAKFDSLSQAEQDRIRARSSLPRMKDRKIIRGVEVPLEREGAGVPLAATDIADAMDRAYDRDPKSKKLVVKDSVPVAQPFTKDEIAAARRKK